MAVPNLHNTFGAAFIGNSIAMLLYGVTTLQTYLYYMYYPNDRRDTKILVAVIWILDTLHISLTCHSMYYYLVSNFGNVAALAVGTWSLYASLAVNLCIAVLVQMFFSLRIFYLCRQEIRWIVSAPIVLMVVVHFAFGIETVVFMFMKEQFQALSQITYYAATPFAVTAVLSDILIAGALCILLYGKRSPFFQTNDLVDSLIVYAINRCLLTSLVAVIEVIVFAILPNSLWFLAIDFVIGKLYANSFLASLNSRGSLRDRELQRNDAESSIRINSARTTEWRVAANINNSRTSRDKYKHRSTTGTISTNL
ncbi:hypothetical protein SCLCIDRAFT_993008 [Scleroderma citrinum Foug A]|uniref:DUF6534 domain-containing protein n=1 Tax=Scleroderma citrinum Foug A TaxID=1036808 RepID=A0A0C3DFM2_9AGAM|nr:hypothetical protein SCLCIDRAFT_993008 [Scleroderma citrinum Foug A]